MRIRARPTKPGHIETPSVRSTERAISPLIFTFLFLISSVPLSHSAGTLHAQNTSSVDLPYDLKKLTDQMVNDDISNNANHAYETLLRSRTNLNEKQEKTVVRHLHKTIRNGDPQQAVYCAAILERWKGTRHHHNYSSHLIPKIFRFLISGPNPALRKECTILLEQMNDVQRMDEKRFAFDHGAVNKLLDRKAWNANHPLKKKMALTMGSFLTPDLTSRTVLRWVLRNTRSDRTGENANRALNIFKSMRHEQIKPILRNAFQADDRQTRQIAAYAYVTGDQFDPDKGSKKLIDILIDGLKDDELDYPIQNASRFWRTLAAIGPPAHSQLENALASDDQQQSQLAAWVLKQSPNYAPTDPYIRELVEGLKDDSMMGGRTTPFANRHWTSDTLLELGERAHPHLVNALDSKDRQQRVYAAKILIKTGHRSSLDRTVRILLNQLKDDDITANAKRTEWFLGAIKQKEVYQKTIRPQLLKLLRTGGPQQCAAVVNILERHELPEPLPENAVKQITKYLDRDPHQKEWVEKILNGPLLVHPIIERRIQKRLDTLFKRLTIKNKYIPSGFVEHQLANLFEARDEYVRYRALLQFLKKHRNEFPARISDLGSNEMKHVRKTGRKGPPNTRLIKQLFHQEKPTLAESKKRKIQRAIKKLGASKYRTREQATNYLKQQEPRIAPLLEPHYPNSNPEIQKRLESILEHLLLKFHVNKMKKRYENVKRK